MCVWGWGGGYDVLFLCLCLSQYFTGGRTDLPQEAIGPKGPNGLIASRGGSVRFCYVLDG